MVKGWYVHAKTGRPGPREPQPAQPTRQKWVVLPSASWHRRAATVPAPPHEPTPERNSPDADEAPQHAEARTLALRSDVSEESPPTAVDVPYPATVRRPAAPAGGCDLHGEPPPGSSPTSRPELRRGVRAPWLTIRGKFYWLV